MSLELCVNIFYYGYYWAKKLQVELQAKLISYESEATWDPNEFLPLSETGGFNPDANSWEAL